MKTQVLSTISDKNGDICVSGDDELEPDVEININIRQDDLQMFWDVDNNLLLRTPEMESGVYIQPVPSSEGFKTEIVISPTGTLTETEPALPAEQPEVSGGSLIETRMD